MASPPVETGSHEEQLEAPHEQIRELAGLTDQLETDISEMETRYLLLKNLSLNQQARIGLLEVHVDTLKAENRLLVRESAARASQREPHVGRPEAPTSQPRQLAIVLLIIFLALRYLIPIRVRVNGNRGGRGSLTCFGFVCAIIWK